MRLIATFHCDASALCARPARCPCTPMSGAWLRLRRRRGCGSAARIDNALSRRRAHRHRHAPLTPAAAHVDHFIAWARYPVDLGHNFVLADSKCNSQKRDRLPACDHLAAWAERNAQFGTVITSELERRGGALGKDRTLGGANPCAGHHVRTSSSTFPLKCPNFSSILRGRVPLIVINQNVPVFGRSAGH
jgi:hypothetical protein